MENASKALIIAGAILIAILLISIGIILVNSGKDITETGTAGMNSQKIQTFNSKFTAYEGTKTGAEVRSLISAVQASNATDDAHQVTVFSNAKKPGNTVITVSSGFSSTQKYKITLNYADGKNAPTTTGTIVKNTAVAANCKSESIYINYILIEDV